MQEFGGPAGKKSKEISYQESVEIASVQLKHYKPEEISLEVDNEKVILHSQHRLGNEDRSEKRELKRVSNSLKVLIQQL